MSEGTEKRKLSVPQEKRNAIKSIVRRALESGVNELLPDHIKPGAMLSSFGGALTREPKLLDCTPVSFVEALVLSATAALPPDGYHAHLVKYADRVVFIPDYKGLIQLALRNGVMIDAYPVYVNDHFEYELGTTPFVKHIPCETEDRGDLRCAYAIARFGQSKKFVVATKSDVIKRKAAAYGTNKADSPWKKWPESMWTKTAVKMLAKYIPRTADLMTRAILIDDTAEMGTQARESRIVAVDMIDQIGLTMPSKTETLGSNMGEQYDKEGLKIPKEEELHET